MFLKQDQLIKELLQPQEQLIKLEIQEMLVEVDYINQELDLEFINLDQDQQCSNQELDPEQFIKQVELLELSELPEFLDQLINQELQDHPVINQDQLEDINQDQLINLELQGQEFLNLEVIQPTRQQEHLAINQLVPLEQLEQLEPLEPLEPLEVHHSVLLQVTDTMVARNEI